MRGSILPPQRTEADTLCRGNALDPSASPARPAAPAPSAIVFCSVEISVHCTLELRLARQERSSDTSSRMIGNVSLPTFFTAMPSANVEPPIGRSCLCKAFQTEG